MSGSEVIVYGYFQDKFNNFREETHICTKQKSPRYTSKSEVTIIIGSNSTMPMLIIFFTFRKQS